MWISLMFYIWITNFIRRTDGFNKNPLEKFGNLDFLTCSQNWRRTEVLVLDICPCLSVKHKRLRRLHRRWQTKRRKKLSNLETKFVLVTPSLMGVLFEKDWTQLWQFLSSLNTIFGFVFQFCISRKSGFLLLFSM